MPMHDDHHRANDEAHVLSLRLALGSILSPKRPQITRSSTTSGTASPAMHCPHSAIPLSPSHSNSGAHPAHAHPMSPAPHAAHSHLAHPHVRAHNQPADVHAHAMAESHPHIPDAVAASVPTAPTSGSSTPNSRAHFVEALQSKSKSWDALIHGSWV